MTQMKSRHKCRQALLARKQVGGANASGSTPLAISEEKQKAWGDGQRLKEEREGMEEKDMKKVWGRTLMYDGKEY